MNSSEINFILKTLRQTKHIFSGVYACDTLPDFIIKKPALLVCNTHPIKKSGEHWISIYISRNNHAEYFDSFGLPPNNKYIINFLKRNAKTYSYNKQMIQSLFSNYCGQFCIMYAFHKGLLKSLNSFLKIFDLAKPNKNNKVVYNFFHKKICYNKSCMNIFQNKLK